MRTIAPLGFYVFRKPLLSIDHLFAFFSKVSNESSFEEQLKETFSAPVLQDAIYQASPTLFSRLQSWQQGRSRANEKLLIALFKYFLRASTRSTPYGMFAGFTTSGKFDDHTSMLLDEEIPFTQNTHIDMRCITQVVESINGLPEVMEQCRYFPNSTLYLIGNNFRYIFRHPNQQGDCAVCSFDASIYISSVLKEAQNGATIDCLSQVLLKYEVTLKQAHDFVTLLINEQILVSEIQIPVVGPHYVSELIKKLSKFNGEEVLRLKLKLAEIHDQLKSTKNLVSKGKVIEELLDTGFALKSKKDILYTNMIFNMKENRIGSKCRDILTDDFDKLLVLNQKAYMPDLEDFKIRFYQRYEEQEIPLLLALDSEIGIEYDHKSKHDKGYQPLLEDIDFGAPQGKHRIEWNFWKSFILKKYSYALFHNQYELILSDEDLETLKENQEQKIELPGTFAAFGNLLADSDQAIHDGNFLFNLHTITGPSAANLLTRFCNDDEDLNEAVRQSIRVEESHLSDAIIAEIVHMTDEKSGNILKRPTLRKFEIPYLSSASVNKECEIPLSDLMISVRQGKEIVLRSQMHNKRVCPRLTSAHNYNNGTSIYRFLCDLQYEDRNINIKWHWSFLEKENFLPRVRYKNIILSRATWTLDLKDYPILSSQNDVTPFISILRKELHMPRYAVISEYDRELFLDLEHPHCQFILSEELLKKNIITLKEFLLTPDNCFLKDSCGRYVNEMIIPFKKTTQANTNGIFKTYGGQIQRSFTIGSEWMYFKIYAGEKTIDTFLRSDVRHLVEGLLRENIIDQWFFVRYADPEYHLRIRFHGNFSKDNSQKLTSIIHLALDKYIHSGVIHKLKTDTYKRELERYGNASMISSESLFFYDSEAVINFLQLLQGDASEDDRWLFAIGGVDALLSDFLLTMNAKLKLISILRNNYFKEFEINKGARRTLDEKYRKHKSVLETLLEANNQNQSILAEMSEILAKRSELNKPIVEKNLLDHDVNLNHLLASYTHMFLNRLFISNPRKHEVVVYHYLYKYYVSAIAREKTYTVFSNV